MQVDWKLEQYIFPIYKKLSFLEKTYSSSRKCVKNHYDSEIADDIFYDPPRVTSKEEDENETSDMSDIDTEVNALENNSGRNHSKRNG